MVMLSMTRVSSFYRDGGDLSLSLSLFSSRFSDSLSLSLSLLSHSLPSLVTVLEGLSLPLPAPRMLLHLVRWPHVSLFLSLSDFLSMRTDLGAVFWLSPSLLP